MLFRGPSVDASLVISCEVPDRYWIGRPEGHFGIAVFGKSRCSSKFQSVESMPCRYGDPWCFNGQRNIVFVKNSCSSDSQMCIYCRHMRNVNKWIAVQQRKFVLTYSHISDNRCYQLCVCVNSPPESHDSSQNLDSELEVFTANANFASVMKTTDKN